MGKWGGPIEAVGISADWGAPGLSNAARPRERGDRESRDKLDSRLRGNERKKVRRLERDYSSGHKEGGRNDQQDLRLDRRARPGVLQRHRSRHPSCRDRARWE